MSDIALNPKQLATLLEKTIAARHPVLWVNTGKRCKQPPFGEMIRFKHDNH